MAISENDLRKEAEKVGIFPTRLVEEEWAIPGSKIRVSF